MGDQMKDRKEIRLTDKLEDLACLFGSDKLNFTFAGTRKFIPLELYGKCQVNIPAASSHSLNAIRVYAVIEQLNPV